MKFKIAICPKCGGQLDNGKICPTCGYVIVEEDLKKQFKPFVILAIIIALEGLLLIGPKFSFMGLFMYYFGLIFFLSGHYVGMYARYIGILFLFSHSVTGMIFMISGCLIPYVPENPNGLIISAFASGMYSDLSSNAYLYINIVIALFVIATLYVIAYNLSDKVRSIKHSKYIPLTLYTIGFGMACLFGRLLGVYL